VDGFRERLGFRVAENPDGLAAGVDGQLKYL
jgi:hypothetical protein